MSQLKKVVFKSLLITLLLLFVFTAPRVDATTLVHRSFEEVVMKADEIFEGEVTSQQSELSANGKTIYTYVTFTQLESIKGTGVNTTKTLRFEGGRVGDDVLTVVGMPTFEVDEKVILFVKGNITNQTLCPLVGWTQGKFVVEVDPITGTEFIGDGLGKKITGFDAQKGELITEKASGDERPVPVPVNGSPDQLVSPIPSSQQLQSSSVLFSKDAFKAKIKDTMQKQVPAKASTSSEPLQEREAVPAPGVTP